MAVTGRVEMAKQGGKGRKAKDRKQDRQVTAGKMQKRIFGTPRSTAMALLLGGCLALSPILGRGALAQETRVSGSPFATVMKINGNVITQYEVDQRKLFLMVLRQPGDPEKEAMRGLIQDRLAAAEARRFGVRLTPEQVSAGMTEFAGRANLSADQLIEALGQTGISAETFRDFVGNGLLWRDIIRGRFASTVSVTEADIDRAIANGAKNTAIQLLLSEIAIPVTGDPEDELALARRLRDEITTEAAFTAAARRYSASPSAGRGGRLDWTPAANLPPQIVQLVLGSGAGQSIRSGDTAQCGDAVPIARRGGRPKCDRPCGRGRIRGIPAAQCRGRTGRSDRPVKPYRYLQRPLCRGPQPARGSADGHSHNRARSVA